MFLHWKGTGMRRVEKLWANRRDNQLAHERGQPKRKSPHAERRTETECTFILFNTHFEEEGLVFAGRPPVVCHGMPVYQMDQLCRTRREVR